MSKASGPGWRARRRLDLATAGNPGSDLEIAVVGAGMAGLYATWRLLEAGVNPDRLRLFEASNRTGGRVLTVSSPQGFAIDMGAHNFSPSHRIVGALVERFGLRAVESVGRSPDGIVHLRGRSLTNTEIARSWFRRPFAYDVSTYMQRRGPARILRKALKEMSFTATGNDRRLRGRPLAEWTLPDALLEVLTPEELRYLADRLIYSFWHQPVQAEAALTWAAQEMFRGKDPMAELEGGMAGLPDALCAEIDRLGGRPVFSHRLAAVTLADPAAPIALTFETPGGHRSLTARRVVLAMPAGAVARIEGLAARPEIKALLSTLAPQRAVTTALFYAEPWWRGLGIYGGASTTDLPARHLRHHGGEQWRTSGAGALLSYADGESGEFWRRLVDGGITSGWIGADHPITGELHRQAERMFGVKMKTQLPGPVATFTHDWNEPESSAAFHMWSSGSRVESAILSALCPIDQYKLHICGEAWSPRQGWIEGALESVDMLLERQIAQQKPRDR